MESIHDGGRQFARSGYALLPDMLDQAALHAIARALGHCAERPTGARQMLALPWCAALADNLRVQLVATGLLSSGFVNVQCTTFEKSRDHNWLVAPHQDLSIPVARRIAHPELTGWPDKDGVQYVQPPVAVLEQLVALRLHVDDCLADDGALKIVPGSHDRTIACGRQSAASRRAR